ncbi:kunitz/BPTI-like toxin [Rhineura floridana]|uniref:kunitz/BPTI-like toxin n=1 Tax=Rhineura floridana TaxID=261503 RepID=UPI002AC89477|nr:kunitz/BPTI-like toxin [Rhineura floridana]
MKSGGLLLLLGLLALWAQLSPASGDRPEFCYLPAEIGPCRAHIPRFFYNKSSGQCELFFYGGCQGNANNFKTLKKCHYTCVEKPGSCPNLLPPGFSTSCLARCANDWKCPGAQKCCSYACSTGCADPR